MQDEILACLKDLLNCYYSDNFEELMPPSQPKKRKISSPVKAASAKKSPLKPSMSVNIQQPSEESCTTDVEQNNNLDQNYNSINLLNNLNVDNVLDKDEVQNFSEKYSQNSVDLFPENNSQDLENILKTPVSRSGNISNSVHEGSYESIIMSLDPKEVEDVLNSSSERSFISSNQKSSESLPISLESNTTEVALNNENKCDNEISLSQWSRGQVVFNKEKVQVKKLFCFLIFISFY